MKKIFLSILLLTFLFSSISHAQDEGKEIERSVKFYTSFEYLPSGNLPQYYFELPSFSYNSIAVGFYSENKSKNRFIEYSLSFSKRSEEGGYGQVKFDTVTQVGIAEFFQAKSNELNIGLRFESGKWIKKISTEKIKVGYSYAARAFYHISDLTSSDSKFYSREREQYSLAIGFVPRVRYNINSKIYLAIQFPFEVFGFGVEVDRIKNPNLTEDQQKFRSGSFSLGGEALIRLGVGVNF